jgi:hypothetical protein
LSRVISESRTLHRIPEALPHDIEIIEKAAFSSCGAQQFHDRLRRETNKYWFQARLTLRQSTVRPAALGPQIHPLTDCITSRKETIAAALKMPQAVHLFVGRNGIV